MPKGREPLRNTAKAISDVDQYLSITIRARRESLGLTQGDVAAGLGVTWQQLQKYEVGRNRMSVGRLWDICKALDLPFSKVMDGYVEPKKKKPGLTPS